MVRMKESIIINRRSIFKHFSLKMLLLFFYGKKFKKIHFFLEISGKKWGNVVNYKSKVGGSSVYWSIQ